MKILFVLVALFTATSSFASTDFGVHSCVPANPLETHLAAVEITGHVADFSSTNIRYSAKVKYADTFSRLVQSQFYVQLSSEGFSAPSVYVNDNFQLNVDFSPAPGGDGNVRLATVEFIPQDAAKVSATLVCKTPILF